MTVFLYKCFDDYESKGCLPLDVESLTDAEAKRLTVELYETLLAFKIRPHVEWGLSARAANVLVRNELLVLWEVQQISVEKIVKLPGCGVRSMFEVYEAGRLNGVDLNNWLQAVNEQYKTTFYRPRKPKQ
jgi:hypothetical protein